MTHEQQHFFDIFTEAFNQYYGETGIITPSIPNNGRPIERLVNRIMNDCLYHSELPTIIKIKVNHCPLSRLEICYFNPISTVSYLYGIILIISDGRRSICFHFPLNTTHTIVSGYFDGNDAVLRAYFSEAQPAPKGYICYLQLFDIPYKTAIFPQKTFGVDSILEALGIIEEHCHEIFCY